ncbi:MAG TPA: hypothetical protein VM187_06480, partial [Niastella sp.]|nr:hypothetical protein [Niastella sp.]
MNRSLNALRGAVAFGLTVVFLGSCGSSEETSPGAEKETVFQQPEFKYPASRKDTVTDTYFDLKVSDPYQWLETDTAAEVREWVKAQNDVTFGYLSKIPFREKIRKRLEEIYNYARASAPSKEGEYYF